MEISSGVLSAEIQCQVSEELPLTSNGSPGFLCAALKSSSTQQKGGKTPLCGATGQLCFTSHLFIYWVEYLLRLEFLKWSGEKGDPEGGTWEMRNQYQTKLSLTKKFGNSASSKGFNYGRPPAFILRSLKPRPHKKRFAHLALICRWQLVARYPANVFNTQSYVNQQYPKLITGSRLNQSSLSWKNVTQDLPTLHANSISPIDLLKFTFAK